MHSSFMELPPGPIVLDVFFFFGFFGIESPVGGDHTALLRMGGFGCYGDSGYSAA